MRPTQVFLASVMVGATAAVFYARVFGPAPNAIETPQIKPVSPSPKATAKPPALPKPATPAANGTHQSPASAPAPSQPAAAAPKAADAAHAKAARLVREETLTPHELRGMLEKTLAGKLADRELTESEYNRLADVILRIRASQRVLQGIPETEGSEEIRTVHADRIAAAFNEIQEITGLAPTEMGDVLAAPESAETPGTDTGRVP